MNEGRFLQYKHSAERFRRRRGEERAERWYGGGYCVCDGVCVGHNKPGERHIVTVMGQFLSSFIDSLSLSLSLSLASLFLSSGDKGDNEAAGKALANRKDSQAGHCRGGKSRARPPGVPPGRKGSRPRLTSMTKNKNKKQNKNSISPPPPLSPSCLPRSPYAHTKAYHMAI